MDELQMQLARLREQIDILMTDYISPKLCDWADSLRGHRETVCDQVRERPLTAVLVAAGVGFMLGRAR